MRSTGAAVEPADEVAAIRTYDDGAHQGIRTAGTTPGCFQGSFHGFGLAGTERGNDTISGLKRVARLKGGAGPGRWVGGPHAAAITVGAASAEAAGRSASKSHRLGFIPVSFLPSRTAMAPGVTTAEGCGAGTAPQIQLYVLLSSRL